MIKRFRDPIEWEESLPIRPSSLTWRAIIKAFYNSPLDKEELNAYHKVAGKYALPSDKCTELLVIAGRRGGKSETIARLAVFEAIYGGHGIALAPGQYGLIPIISPVKVQSQQIMNYCRGLCALPGVRNYLEGEPTATEIKFKTKIIIQVSVADVLNVSGPTIVTAILDEKAKLAGAESKIPDTEVIASLRPALAPVVGAPKRKFIGITSAYIRSGVAYNEDKEWYGKPDAPMLVVKGSTELFNPNVDMDYLEQQRQLMGDKYYAREFLGIWQDVTEDNYFDNLEKCIDKGRTWSPPKDGIDYWAAVDPAWKQDQFALAIVHRERREEMGPLHTVVDLIRVWNPSSKGEVLSTDITLRNIQAILKTYNIEHLYTDQASAPLLIEVGKRIGLHIIERTWHAGSGSESKQAKFGRVRSAMSNSRFHIPDDDDTVAEFASISSKLLQSGGETFNSSLQHDDRVSAIVLAANEAMIKYPDYDPTNRDYTTEFDIRCQEQRAKMDQFEISLMENDLVEDEEEAWKRGGLGFGRGNIDWNRNF